MSGPPPDGLEDVVGDDGPPPRRGGGAVLLGLVAVVAVVVALTRPTDHIPAAVPTTPPPSNATSAAASAPPAQSSLGPALRLDGQPEDVLVAPLGIYVTESDPPALLRFDPAGRRIEAVGPSLYDGAQVRVAGDLAWTWMQGGAGTTFVRSFDARTLRVLATAELRGTAFSAAPYGGRLWLGTDHGLVAVAADGQVSPMPGLHVAAVYAVAADPVRHRLLVASSDAHPLLAAYDPDTRQVTTAISIDVGKPSIAVTDDTVWVAGFGNPGTVLVRGYSAATLTPRPAPPAARLVGPGAIVSAGAHTLWLRDGGSTTLYCIDPRTGAPLQSWEGVESVSSAAGRAYVLTSISVNRLALAAGCRG